MAISLCKTSTVPQSAATSFTFSNGPETWPEGYSLAAGDVVALLIWRPEGKLVTAAGGWIAELQGRVLWKIWAPADGYLVTLSCPEQAEWQVDIYAVPSPGAPWQDGLDRLRASL